MLNELINLAKPSNQRKITSKQLKTIIIQLHQNTSGLSLGQKYSYLVILTKLFLTSNKNLYHKLSRFNKNMFNTPPIEEQTKKKVNNRTTQKKVKIYMKDGQVTKNKITIEQIANNLLQSNRKSVANEPKQQLATVKQQAVYQGGQDITIPPFSPEMMAKVSQDLQKSFKSFSQADSNSKLKVWEPQLLNYKQWLPVTQEDNNRTLQKVPRIRGETRTTRNKKRLFHIKDETLDLPNNSENITLSIQKLATKIKNYDELHSQQGNFVKEGFNFLLPLMTDLNLLKTKILEDEHKINRTKHINTKNKQRSSQYHLFGEHMQALDIDDYKSEAKSQLKEFYTIQDNDPALTARLQTTICEAIDYEHFTKQKISFDDFCEDRCITAQVRAQLFYQLLHLPYNLLQDDPQNFGEIFILKN